MSVVPKTKKPKKAASPPAHPTYEVMISAAITALKDRTGSSRQAILKYLKANYKVGDNVDNQVRLQLPKLVAKGKLEQKKGKGASGSFKVNKAQAAVAKKPAKKPAAKKVAKKPADKKKPAASKSKKAAPKKSSPKKAKKAATKKAAGSKSKTAKKSPSKAKKPSAKKPAAKKAAKKPAAKKAAKKK